VKNTNKIKKSLNPAAKTPRKGKPMEKRGIFFFQTRTKHPLLAQRKGFGKPPKEMGGY